MVEAELAGTIVEVDATDLEEDEGGAEEEVRELEGMEEEGGGEANMSRQVLRGKIGTKSAEGSAGT